MPPRLIDRRRCASAIIVGVAALGLGAAASDERPRFTLGVLRQDGLLVPFAAYDGRSWNTPWPGEAQALAMPISVKDVPRDWWGAAGPDAAWTAWFPDGRSRPLALAAPIRVPVFCSLRLALRTNYMGAPKRPGDPTAPKDALAIGGTAPPLAPIQRVSVNTPDAQDVTALITDKFNRAERHAAKSFERWSHPYGAAEREKLPIRLESYYRAPMSQAGWTAAYVEAIREFPAARRDRGCGLITYVFGWVLRGPGKEPDIDLGGRVTYCDRNDVPFLMPFGRLEVGGDSYWVYQLSSWRDEYYSVVRTRPGDTHQVAGYSGGFCVR
jgi:hypothetical protein